MNKEYALEILECVERAVLEHNSSLAKEAFRYLERLKSCDKDLHNRIYAARHQTRRN